MAKEFIPHIFLPSFWLSSKPFAELISRHALVKTPGLGYRTDRPGPEPETGIRAGGKPGLPRALLDRHSPHRRLQDTERKALTGKANRSASCGARSSPSCNPKPYSNGTAAWSPAKGIFPGDAPPNRDGHSSAPTLNSGCSSSPPENPGWGYDRIVGALANLGFHISDQTLGNIPELHGLGPAPERKRNATWSQFIGRHMELLWATDFFTAQIWTATGPTTFRVLFFLHLQTRRVILGGITPFPNGAWLKQVPVT
jgi:hypothetical protein